MRIPQQRDGVPIDQRRASLLTLPCVQQQGLVWVWAGPLFDYTATAPPDDDEGPVLVDAIEREGVEKSDYSRDLVLLHL